MICQVWDCASRHFEQQPTRVALAPPPKPGAEREAVGHWLPCGHLVMTPLPPKPRVPFPGFPSPIQRDY